MNPFYEELEQDTGCLQKLDSSGDIKLYWNKKKPDEVTEAKAMFEQCIAKGWAAFKITRFGKKDKKVTEFDPDMGKVVIIPPIAGG